MNDEALHLFFAKEFRLHHGQYARQPQKHISCLHAKDQDDNSNRGVSNGCLECFCQEAVEDNVCTSAHDKDMMPSFFRAIHEATRLGPDIQPYPRHAMMT